MACSFYIWRQEINKNSSICTHSKIRTQFINYCRILRFKRFPTRYVIELKWSVNIPFNTKYLTPLLILYLNAYQTSFKIKRTKINQINFKNSKALPNQINSCGKLTNLLTQPHELERHKHEILTLLLMKRRIGANATANGKVQEKRKGASSFFLFLCERAFLLFLFRTKIL